jgi:hypothetical protein
MNTGYKFITPVFTNERLSDFISRGLTGAVSLRLGDQSVICLESYRRPEDRILFILESAFPKLGLQLAILFEQKMNFYIKDTAKNKSIDSCNKEMFLAFLDKIKPAYPAAFNLFYETLIWNQ